MNGKQEARRTLWFWIVGAFVGLYTTLVVELLWNWFVTTAFHVPAISFWVTYGLVLIVGMFTYNDRFEEKHESKILTVCIDACVPDDKRESVREELNALNDGIWWDAAVAVFARIVGNTYVLLLGWAVHTFLA